MQFALKRLVPPEQEPVDFGTMKSHLALDESYTADDALIQNMIASARSYIENYTGRCLLPQQWMLARDFFPAFRVGESAPARSDFDALGNYNFNSWRSNDSQTIRIPKCPLISVDSIKYMADTSGTLTTLDPSLYQVDLLSEPGRVLPSPLAGCWPQTAPMANAVQVTFTAGYADGGSVPDTIMQALRLTVAAWYSNRENFMLGVSGATELPLGVCNLLDTEAVQPFGLY
jgi:uncharacterized phiE125 gp8 family phage protein